MQHTLKTPRRSDDSDVASSSEVPFFSLLEQAAVGAVLLVEGELNTALQCRMDREQPEVRTAFNTLARRLLASVGKPAGREALIVERTPVRGICAGLDNDTSVSEDMREQMEIAIAKAVSRRLKLDLKAVPEPAAVLEELRVFASCAPFDSPTIPCWDATQPAREQVACLHMLHHDKHMQGCVYDKMPTLVDFAIHMMKQHLGVPW